ncbi:MAG: hypothetical protein ACXWEJ_11075, partial [Actinomycetota bacterium]
MSERANVLVTRPIMEEPMRILRERCDVTVHENEFGIPRDELLKVVSGRNAIITMLTEKVDGEFLESAGPQLKIVADHAVGFDNIDVAACTGWRAIGRSSRRCSKTPSCRSPRPTRRSPT